MNIEFLYNAINKANNKQSDLPIEILEMEGMSSVKIRHLLNNICNFEGCNLLETGRYKGSTLCSSIYNNSLTATSIEFWPNKEELDQTRKIVDENLEKTLKLETRYAPKNIKIIDEDCFLYNKKDLKLLTSY